MFNEPIEVEWAGFRSDTFRMHQAGWEVSAEQDPYRQTMRLAFQFKQQGMTMAQGITEVEQWEYRDRAFRRRPMWVRFGPKILLQMMGTVEARYWSPVDPVPVFEPKWEPTDLEDFLHFRRPNDIIIPEDCVSDLLDRALKVQQPIRDEEMARRARRNHGSLVTLA